MNASATPAGPGPDLPDEGDDSAHLRALVESERVVGSEAETDDALDGLASLLLDSLAAARDRGVLPRDVGDDDRPDARRRNSRPPSPPAGGEAA